MKVTLALAAAFGAVTLAAMQSSAPPVRFEMTAVSTDPARVTGGDVLLRVTAPGGSARPAKVMVSGRDVSAAFHPGPAANSWLGLVTGLALGKNTIEPDGGAAGHASLVVTNYPITGPVFSGPWLQPYICQTEAFALPDGSKLGPPLDPNCS